MLQSKRQLSCDSAFRIILRLDRHLKSVGSSFLDAGVFTLEAANLSVGLEHIGKHGPSLVILPFAIDAQIARREAFLLKS
jgi:hypothetical protein